MTSRHILALATAALAVGGCNASHTTDGEGVCCPVTDFTGCSPGGDPLPAGGWASSLDECTRTISGWDGAPFVRSVDSRGCMVVVEGEGCCGCIDPPPPPPPPPECDSLGVIDCLQAGCVPTFDDMCCPVCDPEGGCADCVDWEYYTCRPFEDACMAAYCSATSPWACGMGLPDCSGANRTDEDSCDIPGCVPATAPEGFMDPIETCVPITAESCSVACRRIAPDCPEGTVPEGDGSCYTDRCIPGWICG